LNRRLDMASPISTGPRRNSELPPPCPATVRWQNAYLSGDPYLAFAKQAKAAPKNATKQTQGPTRELFKQCVRAAQYGMKHESLAAQIGPTADRRARFVAGAPRNLSGLLALVGRG